MCEAYSNLPENSTLIPFQCLNDWLSDADIARQALSHTVLTLVGGAHDVNDPELTGVFRQLEVMDAHFGMLLDRFESLLSQAQHEFRIAIEERTS